MDAFFQCKRISLSNCVILWTLFHYRAGKCVYEFYWISQRVEFRP
jgi:hypothetical protein